MAGWTLVTGASGFIGARIVRRLVEKGERVKAFVRPGANLSQLQGLPRERFQLAFGEIIVEHTVYRALAGCDRLIHAASPYQVWARRDSEIIGPAVAGTEAVLTAAQRHGVKRVVVTGSVAALGVNDSAQPMDESHRFNLTSVYARSKQLATQKALELAAHYRLPMVVVHPSAVMGPGDWRPTPTGKLIVRYLALGGFYRLPCFEGGINVVDVDDVVDGHVLALTKGRAGESYILGGENLSYEQVYKMLSELTGLFPPGSKSSVGFATLLARFLQLRAAITGQPPEATVDTVNDHIGRYAWVSSRKAEEELGYAHRPARETLARSVRWFLANGYVPAASARRVRLEVRMA